MHFIKSLTLKSWNIFNNVEVCCCFSWHCSPCPCPCWRHRHCPWPRSPVVPIRNRPPSCWSRLVVLPEVRPFLPLRSFPSRPPYRVVVPRLHPTHRWVRILQQLERDRLKVIGRRQDHWVTDY